MTTMAAVAQGEPVAGTDSTVRVEDVSKWYGNVVAVNSVTFGVGPGITGLLGPNGAGKSTLLHMLAGFLAPSSGSVEILGERAFGNPELYRHVGLVPEREAVYSFLTGRQFVVMSAKLHDLPDPEEAARRAIERVELTAAQDRPTGGYSKGMKQRIKVAAAIVHEPGVLLLDEPFNGADPRQRLQMMDMLREMAAGGVTVVFSSHILEEVERLAENVLVVVNGRLAASGDFRTIRRLMTDRPHTFTVHSSDNRRLASALMSSIAVDGVELLDDALSVRASDFASFTLAVAGVARQADVTLYELLPADESLESVFSYLVNR
ncbi:MAG TPA: ABC transporter ATP-binding protein [Tepidiformaceae bacterium]|nr:ABC transporter ATP-binding protein [Tepidiformaceae bacterium]